LQLSEELRSREKREKEMMEELAGLKDALKAEEQTKTELSEERDRLVKQLEEAEVKLQRTFNLYSVVFLRISTHTYISLVDPCLWFW
jgi:predicted  nucleic acid-binding Zn-ribbon protein